MRLIAGFFLTALLLAGLPGLAELPLTPTGSAPTFSQAQAIARARQITGLATESVEKAEYGLATDATIPFVNVEKRPVWQITFSRMRIRSGEEYHRVNHHLRDLTVLLDAHSGALLRAETVIQSSCTFVDRTGAVLHLRSPQARPRGITMIDRRQIEGQSQMMPTAARPALPLLKVLPKVVTDDTSQVQAYFGLYTNTFAPKQPINQRPSWLLVSDGHLLLPHGPPGSDHTPKQANEMDIFDAHTGENIGGIFLTAVAFQIFPLDGFIDTTDPGAPQLTLYLYNGSDHPVTFTSATLADRQGKHTTVVDITPVQPIAPGRVGVKCRYMRRLPSLP